jgi:chemotaxis receptor (MCP) glutamine deamidase CheD
MIEGMAHGMLPGKSAGENRSGKAKHTVNALETLIKDMEKLGASWEKLNICMACGGSVLEECQEKIGAIKL